MKVVKFGGSSLADGAQFRKVKEIVEADKSRRYVVVSAPGKGKNNDHKVTDLLYMCYQLASHGLNFDEVYGIIRGIYKSICQELELTVEIDDILDIVHDDIRRGASRDYTASRGEFINGILMANFLGFEFVDAKDIIVFDEDTLNPIKTEDAINAKLSEIEYAVIPGFYGANEKGEIVTFSRGGSDVTGSLIANGVHADLYENWTDVSGFLMADPKTVKGAKTIENITYKELRELSYMGAPVLHEESIFPVKKHQIPINIKNTNNPEDPGTIIISDENVESKYPITGIAGKKDFSVISIEKTLMNSELDFFRKLISVFETNDIPIEHMPSSIDSISVIVPTAAIAHKLSKVMEEIKIYCKPNSIVAQSNMALLAVVGRGMVRTKGISGRIFTALAKSGVNIRMISQGSSEMNIIIGIENEDFQNAIRAIYVEFN